MITHHHINNTDNLYALIGSATTNLGYVTGTRNVYTATPAGLTPGVHSYAIYLRAGSNPATTDTLLATGEIIINNEPAIITAIDAVKTVVDSTNSLAGEIKTIATDAKSEATAAKTTAAANLKAADYTAPDNAKLAQAKTAIDAVNAKLPADTTEKINRLDANVSTRLSASDYSEPDNAKIAQTKTAIDAVNAKLPADTTDKINRLDANVSTRLAASDYSEPDNAKLAQAKTAIDAVNAKLPADTTDKINRLDANVSTRLAASDYTAPDNSKIADIKNTIETLAVDTAAAVNGVGEISVDHNYGGSDKLRIVAEDDNNLAVSDVDIEAVFASDLDAGKRIVRAQTKTLPGGRWESPLKLSAGKWYLLISKQQYINDKMELDL